MSKLTSGFSQTAAKLFLDSVKGNTDHYYIGAHKSSPWNEEPTPEPIDTTPQGLRQIFDDLIFAKKVGSDDVVRMIPNRPWVANTTYPFYDGKKTGETHYVVTEDGGNHGVFLCLNNNGPSTIRPSLSQTNLGESSFKTSDGYQWKLMFIITPSQWSKFATNEFIPVFESDVAKNAAVPGSIETVIVENSGSEYNSYAFGAFRESSTDGSLSKHILAGDGYGDFLVTVDNVTGFTNEQVTSVTGNITATGFVVAIDSNTLLITRAMNSFEQGSTILGSTSNATASITNVVRKNIPLSANANFYSQSAIYIASGTGSGQIRTITDYDVRGDDRIITVDTPFSPLPDQTSRFKIGPSVKVNGDGNGMRAIATVNPTSNTIHSVEVITPGSGYTFAEAIVSANTGRVSVMESSVTTTSAKLRPIISPEGGFGKDSVSQLESETVGISLDLETDTLPNTNDYRQVSLMKNIETDNITLDLSTNNGNSYEIGEFVSQNDTTGKVKDKQGGSLVLTNVKGSFANGSILGVTSNTSSTVSNVTGDFINIDNRIAITVDVQYAGSGGSGFVVNETIHQKGNSGSNTIALVLSTNVDYSIGDIVTQNTTNATGVVSSRTGNRIELSNVTGTFIATNSTETIRTQSNTTPVSVSEVQYEIPEASAKIHTIDGNTLYLTDVKGEFRTSNDASSVINTINGLTSLAVANVQTKSQNKIVPNSGKILYVDNFTPVTRNAARERVKLLVQF